jgi:hypothetical protein
VSRQSVCGVDFIYLRPVPSTLRSPGRAIWTPSGTSRSRRCKWILRRKLFINIYTKSGLAVAIRISLDDLRRPWEDFLHLIREEHLLLNAEIIRSVVEVHIDGVAYWRDVLRAVSRGADAEQLTADRSFTSEAQTPGGRDMDTNEVNPAIGYQRQPFVLIYK